MCVRNGLLLHTSQTYEQADVTTSESKEDNNADQEPEDAPREVVAQPCVENKFETITSNIISD